MTDTFELIVLENGIVIGKKFLSEIFHVNGKVQKREWSEKRMRGENEACEMTNIAFENAHYTCI